MSSLYARTFRAVLIEAGIPDVDPRHAEAWARVEWGTLDGRSRSQLRRLVVEMRPILTDPTKRSDSEALARSYGL